MIKPSMKKAAALATSVLGFLTAATSVWAQVNVKITPPPGIIAPTADVLGIVISNTLRIVLIAAVILVLVYLIIGAFQWITSGGDKEAVGKARGRITAALIGLVILALAFVIAQVIIVSILGFPSIVEFNLPRLDQAAPTPTPTR